MTIAIVRIVVVLLVVVMTACSGSPGSPTGPSTSGDFTVTHNGVKLTFSANVAGGWNFGNGQTGNGQTVVHTYEYFPGEARTYSVSFTPEGGGAVTKSVEVKPLQFAIRPSTKAVLRTEPNLPITGYCLGILPYAGRLVPHFVVTPGGSMIRMYLVKRSEGINSYCRQDGSCVGSILGVVDSNSSTISASWPVETEEYCVRMVNISDTAQELNGSIDLEIPFQP